MSYLVLARKYRPMRFNEVIGQEHVTITLENAIKQDRLANAYLFSGPRGVGKTTIARILAKAINCEKGPTTEPCNQCNSCKEITNSRSLEVIEIDGASNRGIDEVRNLRENLRYAATPGKYKIHIIDEVHMLTTEAFNALLKTLEEPPKNVLFIFATTEPHKVPATIVSRCQRFNFKRISTRDITNQLRILCENEGITIDEESLRLVARKADGSMRDAQSILDQIISYTGEKISLTDVSNLLGVIDQELLFKVSDLIKQSDVDGAVDLAGKIFLEGIDFNEFLIGITEHFRNFLFVNATGSSANLDIPDAYRPRYESEYKDFSIEDLLRLIKIASEAEQEIRRSSNSRLKLEIALIKMVRLDKSVLLSQLLKQVDDIKKKTNQSAVTPDAAYNSVSTVGIADVSSIIASVTASADAKRQNQENDAKKSGDRGLNQEPAQQEQIKITLAEIEDQWLNIVEEVKKRKIALGSFLSEGWPTLITGNILEITFGKNNGFHISSIEKNKDFIQKIIKDALGIELRLVCKKDEEGKLEKVNKRPVKQDHHSKFKYLVDSNPNLKAIIETFDAILIN